MQPPSDSKESTKPSQRHVHNEPGSRTEQASGPVNLSILDDIQEFTGPPLFGRALAQAFTWRAISRDKSWLRTTIAGSVCGTVVPTLHGWGVWDISSSAHTHHLCTTQRF